LPDKNSTLLFVSHQAAGSLGRLLAEGAQEVNILGEKVEVAARVEKIEGYSSHLDLNGLYEFVKNTADSLKKVFVVHGELKTNLFFVQRLRDYMGVNAISPKDSQSFELEL
jgi:metallo-beta-lactamase family protein